MLTATPEAWKNALPASDATVLATLAATDTIGTFLKPIGLRLAPST